MKLRLYLIFYLILFCFPLFQARGFIDDFGCGSFIETRDEYDKVFRDPHVIVVASTGCSGSSLLFMTLENFALGKRILKTHCLPPRSTFRGKIFFIFSNPDRTAESALHRSLRSRQFGIEHFRYMETADKDWLLRIKETPNQTISDNILAYDVFGCALHLTSWLYRDTQPCSIENAQVMAIKYEHLWDKETISAMKNFLKVELLQFPLRRNRGHRGKSLSDIERLIRLQYNVGTETEPRYVAYDEARALWKAAPPYQFLRLID